MAVMLQIEVCWVVMQCSVVVGYRRFSAVLPPPLPIPSLGLYLCRFLSYRPFHPEDGGSVDFWNAGILPQQYTALQPSEDGVRKFLRNVGILQQQYTALQSSEDGVRKFLRNVGILPDTRCHNPVTSTCTTAYVYGRWHHWKPWHGYSLDWSLWSVAPVSDFSVGRVIFH